MYSSQRVCFAFPPDVLTSQVIQTDEERAEVMRVTAKKNAQKYQAVIDKLTSATKKADENFSSTDKKQHKVIHQADQAAERAEDARDAVKDKLKSHLKKNDSKQARKKAKDMAESAADSKAEAAAAAAQVRLREAEALEAKLKNSAAVFRLRANEAEATAAKSMQEALRAEKHARQSIGHVLDGVHVDTYQTASTAKKAHAASIKATAHSKKASAIVRAHEASSSTKAATKTASQTVGRSTATNADLPADQASRSAKAATKHAAKSAVQAKIAAIVAKKLAADSADSADSPVSRKLQEFYDVISDPVMTAKSRLAQGLCVCMPVCFFLFVCTRIAIVSSR
jgi:hypothetical protein